MNFIRKGELAEKILITDGLPGCGNHVQPNLPGLDEWNVLFAFEIEFIARLFYF